MEQFPNSNEPPQKSKKELGGTNSDINSGRRKFLKSAAYITGGVITFMAGSKLFSLAVDHLNRKFQNQLNEDIQNAKAIADKQTAQYKSIFGKEFETPDGQIVDQISEKETPEIGKKLSQILSFESKDKVNLTLNLAKKIKERWIMEYSKGGSMHESLLIGWKRMQPWLPRISGYFQQEKYSHEVLNAKGNDYEKKEFSMDSKKLDKYVYLALPESHFDIDGRSPSGAIGAYQFMKQTAKNAFLEVSETLDERKDPVKSAEACARHITYLYNACRQNESLALSGYNKGTIWEYLKQKNNEKVSYEDFLKFISQDINEKKQFFQNKNNRFLKYKIQKGDSLQKISQIFYCPIEKIKKMNGIRKDNLKIGAEIKIPLIDLKQRKILYENSININGLIENLNYPGKFEAVLEVLKTLNQFGKSKFLPSGIKIIQTSGGQSLRNFAKNKEDEKRLIKINPHISSSIARLPKGTNIFLKVS